MSKYLLTLYCRFHYIYLNFSADTFSVNLYVTHVYTSILCLFNILRWLVQNNEASGKNAYSCFYSINVLIIHPFDIFLLAASCLLCSI